MTRRVVCAWEGLVPAEGAETLWCDVLVSVPLGETVVRGIAADATIGDVRPKIARRVVAGNVEREQEDGATAVLPPPAELSEAGFLKVGEAVTGWLAWAVRIGWRTAGDAGKGVELARAHGRASAEWRRAMPKDRAEHRPVAPEDVARLLWLDCSPMRPSAWADEWADRWYDAWDVQASYRHGVTEVTAATKKSDKRAAATVAFDEEDE